VVTLSEAPRSLEEVYLQVVERPSDRNEMGTSLPEMEP
jgi:hypothetical protein